MFDRWEVPGAKGLFGAVEDVFELGEPEGLREDSYLLEEERVAGLGLLGVYGERFGGPDTLRGGEIAFGEVDDAGEFLVAFDSDVREFGEGGGRLFAMKERGIEHAGAFEELELRSEFG